MRGGARPVVSALALLSAATLGACTGAPAPGGTRAGATTTTTARTTTTVAPTSTSPPGTVEVTYQAFVGDHLDPRLTVTSSDSGSCIRYGGGVDRHWYYRCFGTTRTDGHTFVYDPCFDGPSGTAAPLACVTNPMVPRVVQFTVTSADTATPPATAANPWAMQLASGQVCVFVSAAWGSGGPFGCQAFSGPGSMTDCHEPVAGQPWWSAACQAQDSGQSSFVPQQIVRIWF